MTKETTRGRTGSLKSKYKIKCLLKHLFTLCFCVFPSLGSLFTVNCTLSTPAKIHTRHVWRGRLSKTMMIIIRLLLNKKNAPVKKCHVNLLLVTFYWHFTWLYWHSCFVKWPWVSRFYFWYIRTFFCCYLHFQSSKKSEDFYEVFLTTELDPEWKSDTALLSFLAHHWSEPMECLLLVLKNNTRNYSYHYCAFIQWLPFCKIALQGYWWCT